DGVLTSMIALTAPDAVVVPTLRPGDGLLSAAAGLHAAGVEVDWTAVLGTAVAPVELPTYAFEHEQYWLKAPAAATGAVDGPFWDLVERGDAAALAETLNLDDQDAVGAVLPALERWHRTRREGSAIDQLCYSEDWEPITATGRLDGMWLLHAAADAPAGLATGLRAAMLRHGAAEVRITPDRDGLGEYARQAVGEGLQGVVVVPGASLEDTVAVRTTLAEVATDTPLWIVNGGAGPAWGLDRASVIDLAADVGADALDRVAQLLAGPEGEDRLAIRGTEAYVRRIQRLDPGDSGTPVIHGAGLVAGDDPETARRLARWLRDRGADPVLTVDPADPGSFAAVVGHHPVAAVAYAPGADGGVAAIHQSIATAAMLRELATETAVLLTVAPGAGTLPAETTETEVAAAVGAALAAWSEQGRAATTVWLEPAIVESPELLGAVLDRAVGSGHSRILAADVDWERAIADRPARQWRRAWLGVPEAAVLMRAGDGEPAVTWRETYAAAAPAERPALVRDLVHDHVRHILGHPGGVGIDAERGFLELGFASVTGVELSQRLAAAAGVRLPATLIFDHATVAAVAEYLARLLEEQAAGPGGGPGADVDRLERALAVPGPERDRIAARLERLLSRWRAADTGAGTADGIPDLASAGVDEVLSFIDDLGLSSTSDGHQF
ncbi:phosphopantetheine-binding protein, partial [Dactylosporangium sucinum]